MPDRLPAGFFLTDPARIENPLAAVAALPRDVGVIIRHFGQAEEIRRAGSIVRFCHETGRHVLVAADPALAGELKADGVHWPARLAPVALRHKASFQLNTMSAHTPSELRRAVSLGMDAGLVSTVFASDSPSAGQPMGVMRLAAVSNRAPIPVYALGGIGPQTITRVAPFAGAASVSGWF